MVKAGAPFCHLACWKWHQELLLPPFRLKPTVTRQQQAEPTCFCWEHLRPPCQLPSPSSGFVNNSCSLQTVTTIPYSLLTISKPKAQKCLFLTINYCSLTVKKCCWSASWWRLAAPGTFHISGEGWSSENPSLLGPRYQTAPAAEEKKRKI